VLAPARSNCVQNVGGQIFSIFLVGPLGGPLSGPQSGPGSGTRRGGSYFSMHELYYFTRRPANEEADILADKAILDARVGKEWCQQVNRAFFAWKKTSRKAGRVTCQDRHSTLNNSVRHAIRRGAVENEVPKYEEKRLVLVDK